MICFFMLSQSYASHIIIYSILERHIWNRNEEWKIKIYQLLECWCSWLLFFAGQVAATMLADFDGDDVATAAVAVVTSPQQQFFVFIPKHILYLHHVWYSSNLIKTSIVQTKQSKIIQSKVQKQNAAQWKHLLCIPCEYVQCASL